MKIDQDTGEVLEEEAEVEEKVEVTEFKTDIELPVFHTNFEDVEKSLAENLKLYEIDVTEETVGIAKKKTTALRALSKTVDRMRIDKAKEAKAPISEWETKVKQIILHIDNGVEFLAKQTDKFEQITKDHCLELLNTLRDDLYNEQGLKEEYRDLDCSSMAILSNIAKQKLTKKAVKELTERVLFRKMVQDKTDFRLLKLETDCKELLTPLTKADIEHFLLEDDATYARDLENLISLKKESEEKTAAALAQKKIVEDEQKQKDDARAEEIIEEKKEEEKEIDVLVDKKIAEEKGITIPSNTRKVTVVATFELEIKREITDSTIAELFKERLKAFDSLRAVQVR